MNIRSLSRSTTLAAALAVGLLSLSTGSFAASSEGEALKATVKYGDLRLDRQEGIQKLYQLVKSAGEQVCNPFQSRELNRMSEWKKCVNGAVSRAVVVINVPALTAYANARGAGQSAPEIVAAR